MQKLRYLLIIVAVVISAYYGFVAKSFPLFAGFLAAAYLLFVLEYALHYLGYQRIRKHGESRRAVLVECIQTRYGQQKLLHGESYRMKVCLDDEQFTVRGAFEKPPCEIGDELDVMFLEGEKYVVLPDAKHRSEFFSHILMRCLYVLLICFLIGLFVFFRMRGTFTVSDTPFSETDAMARAQLGLD